MRLALHYLDAQPQTQPLAISLSKKSGIHLIQSGHNGRFLSGGQFAWNMDSHRTGQPLIQLRQGPFFIAILIMKGIFRIGPGASVW